MFTGDTLMNREGSSERAAHHQFAVTVDVDTDADRVWAVMSDVERWSEWTASIRSVRLRDPGPLRVGSRALIRQPRLLPALWTVVSLEPGRAFTWRSGAPGLWVYGTHAVAPAGSGARVTLVVRNEGALAWLVTRLLGNLTKRYVQMEAEGLKRQAEQAQHAPVVAEG